MVDASLLADVLDTTETIVRGVRPDQDSLPTPCPDYSVGDLLDHVVGWLYTFADGAEQRPHRENPAMYHAGANPGDEFHAAAIRAVDAFKNGAGDRPIDLGNGESPGAMIFGMMLIEYIGHGWDLAVATDQAAPYSERTIDAAQEAANSTLAPQYRGPDKSFGVEQPVPENAAALDRFVAFIGRTPTG